MGLWNTFFSVKEQLDRQYQNTSFAPDTGLSTDALSEQAALLRRRMAGQSAIRVKAALFSLALSQGRVAVDPFDWFADHLNHADILIRAREELNRSEEMRAISRLGEDDARCSAMTAILDTSHTSPDWERILALGLIGLRDEAAARLAALEQAGKLTPPQRDFLESVITVYEAMAALCRRLAAQALRVAPLHPENAGRMARVAAALEHIASQPPQTLHQAMQLAYIYHECQEFEGEPVRSMGGFDRLYGRFYEADLKAGRLTRQQAKELIEFFFNKFYARTEDRANGKNFYFAGELPGGTNAVNDLSYLALEAYLEMRTVNPKLSVRVSPVTPDAFLRLAADCIRQGCSGIVFSNDPVQIDTLRRFGKTIQEARNHVLIGCYEPGIQGAEMNRSVSVTLSLPKMVELAMNDGFDPVYGGQVGVHTGLQFDSFEALCQAVEAQTRHFLTKGMDMVRAFEPHWPHYNPSPVLSGTMAHCLKTGLDVSMGGTKYNNAGVVCGSIASAVDSLCALKTLVFDEGRVTLDQMRAILKNDWAGEEKLRLFALRRAPKWGNNDEVADGIARRLSDFLSDTVNKEPNTLGGHFQLAQFSIDFVTRFGRDMLATPDGRRRGELTSKNLAAVTAMDRRGVTAMIQSAGKLDYTGMPDGSVLDCVLHPSAVGGEDGLTAFVSLIRSYFALGGACIQFNVFDAATLRAAQKEPEKYATLQVRVCGWNVYFNHLTRAEQDEFIRQAEHEEGVT